MVLDEHVFQHPDLNLNCSGSKERQISRTALLKYLLRKTKEKNGIDAKESTPAVQEVWTGVVDKTEAVSFCS